MFGYNTFVTGLCINTFFPNFKSNSQYLRVIWWETGGWEPMRIGDGGVLEARGAGTG